MADRTEYKSAVINDLAKQSNISELEVNKEELMKEIESEVVKVVEEMQNRNKN